MKKDEFLRALRTELQGLNSEDIDEIVQDQEEFIRDAMSAGRSEEDVVRSLGSPKAFADSVRLEYKVNKINNSSNTWESYREVFGSIGILIALAPINLILLFGPVFAILGFLFTWIMSSGAIIVAGAVCMLTLFIATFAVGLSFLQAAAVLFLCVGIIALGMCGVAMFVMFSQLFIRIFTAYAKWNLELINGRRA